MIVILLQEGVCALSAKVVSCVISLPRFPVSLLRSRNSGLKVRTASAEISCLPLTELIVDSRKAYQ